MPGGMPCGIGGIVSGVATAEDPSPWGFSLGNLNLALQMNVLRIVSKYCTD
jgi:hypothetical protein